MKLYLAAPYSARNHLREVAEDLASKGHDVTSRWLWDNHEIKPESEGAAWAQSRQYIAQHVMQDLEDVEEADALVMFTGAWVAKTWPSLADTALHSGGRHVEMGYAIAKGKAIIVMGSPENVFHRGLGESLDTFYQLKDFLANTLVCVECGNTFAIETSTRCTDCLERLL